MVEHADGLEMCITLMSLILNSPDVASASGTVAELFCRNRFGGTAVGMGFERRILVNQVTGWMVHNVGQQRLRAAEQRVKTAREQQSESKWLRSLSQAMRHDLATSSTSEASVARDADVVEKDQMCGEESVSVSGSPMCQTFRGVIMTITRDAN